MLTGLLAPLAAAVSVPPLAALAATATSCSVLAPQSGAALPTTWDSAGNAARALGPVLPALDTIRRFYAKTCATLTKN
jgi:hypothetical protein